MQKDTSLGSTKKKKKSDELDLKSFPDKFNAHIAQAQNWLMMKTSNTQLNLTTNAKFPATVFEHPTFGDVGYEIHTQDVRKLHEVVHPRPYTLALIDIPYGFARSGCLHDDTVAWGVEELSNTIQSFKVVAIARLWRIIVLHSIDQYEAVKTVLQAECNVGIQNCIW